MRRIFGRRMEMVVSRVAVIGLGNISKRHRANLRTLYPDATIIAVSSSGRKYSKSIDNADEYLTSVDELLRYGIDMAIVASPATYHAQHAIPLLQAGVPVLIEKPLAACQADAEAIAKVADETKTPVAVGYCLRYLSSSQNLKALLDKGVVGDIYNVHVEIGQYLPDWRPGQNYRETVSANAKLGGGALLELSHELDYVQWLFGRLTPHSVILRSSAELGLTVEDLVDALAINDKGAVVSLHLDFLQRKAYRKCRVIGSKGSVDWDLINNQIVFVADDGQSTLFDEHDWDRNQMYLSMLKDFQRKINGQEHHCMTLSEAQQTVSLIEQLKALALKGCQQ